MKGYLTSIVAVLVLFLLIVAPPAAAQKIQIEKLDDLPRHTYKIDIKAVELFDNNDALLKLAHEVQKDLEGDLEKYEIPDKSTLQNYYGMLGVIAIMDKRYDDYLKYYEMYIELEDKEAERLTTGLFTRSYLKADRENAEDMATAIKAEYNRLVNELPYDIVAANLKSAKASAEVRSRNLYVGIIDAEVQPVLDQSNGEMSKDIAEQIIGAGYTINYYLPYKQVVIDVLTEYLDANKVEKQDIWAEREVTLAEGEGKAPVVVCVWDSGTDLDVFKDHLWVNGNEVPENGVDDDNNGFIDDVHGIAYTLHSDKTPELLYPIGDIEKDRSRLQRLMKGLSDLQANIDSEESSELKKMMSQMKPEEVKPFLEDINKYGNFAHGTHVAGIALRGNPYAKLLTSRLTFDYRLIPDEPTVEQARKDSAATVENIQYFVDNGVRVVNMSWGGSLAAVEQALEANNAGGTPEERKALARQIYEIGKGGLYEAIQNASNILFITSAGNFDNDVKFEEILPSGFDLPNIMSVGAVDLAGDETSFTSFGKVDVYANGFEVPSHVPGGDEMRLSGTSQASPNVTNLAAKLLAVNPDLTPDQLFKLIVNAADVKTAGDREVKLLNPKKSFEMLLQM